MAIISADINRHTCENISGWPSVLQSLEVGLTTDFGTRNMREWYGTLVPRALGKNMTEDVILGLTMSIAACINLFEPRYYVTKCYPASLGRGGSLLIEIEGEYRPRALYGDEKADGVKKISLGQSSNGGVSILNG